MDSVEPTHFSLFFSLVFQSWYCADWTGCHGPELNFEHEWPRLCGKSQGTHSFTGSWCTLAWVPVIDLLISKMPYNKKHIFLHICSVAAYDVFLPRKKHHFTCGCGAANFIFLWGRVLLNTLVDSVRFAAWISPSVFEEEKSCWVCAADFISSWELRIVKNSQINIKPA